MLYILHGKLINGFDMLVYQAVAAEEIWFDEEIDPQLTEKARKELSDFYRENN